MCLFAHMWLPAHMSLFMTITQRTFFTPLPWHLLECHQEPLHSASASPSVRPSGKSSSHFVQQACGVFTSPNSTPIIGMANRRHMVLQFAPDNSIGGCAARRELLCASVTNVTNALRKRNTERMVSTCSSWWWEILVWWSGGFRVVSIGFRLVSALCPVVPSSFRWCPCGVRLLVEGIFGLSTVFARHLLALPPGILQLSLDLYLASSSPLQPCTWHLPASQLINETVVKTQPADPVLPPSALPH